jgi:hypothetical protein
MRRTAWLVGIAIMIAAAGCGETIDIDPADTTPPTIGLDVFGIPLQGGAASQPNPETLTDTCCDVTRSVAANTNLDLIGTVRDAESGVARARIWQDLRVTCRDPNSDLASDQGPASSTIASVGGAPTSPRRRSPASGNHSTWS